MAPTRFSIILDNPIGSYFPGQVVTGKVILGLAEEKNTQGVKLKFTGDAEVGWQEQGQGGSKGYYGKEPYFSTKIVLVGDEKSSDISIPAGDNVYPFTFQLPLNLPSSFEGEFGNVRYTIEAIVKRSWKFDYNTKTMFTVNALVDLNLQPVYAEPQEASKEKSICCLCCKEGPISMKVELGRTGYVPGEHVKFSVNANNSSSRPVSAIMVLFIREISFRARGRTRHKTEEITKIRGPEVQPFQSESWQSQFQIPPVPPSDLGGCKIIGMMYLLKFKLDIPSSIDLKKKIPVIVGTIPYTNFLEELQKAQNLSQALPIVPEGGNQVISLPPLDPSAPPIPLLSKYPSMPYPIYQDASIFGKGEDDVSDNAPPPYPVSSGEIPLPGDDVDVEFKYTPKYATYNYGWNFNSAEVGQNAAGSNGEQLTPETAS